MKIKSLEIVNIGKIEHAIIDINKPLIRGQQLKKFIEK